MSNGTFDFNSFIKDSKDVLFNPKAYFSSMKTTGGLAEPLIKAVLYGVVSGIFALLWGLLKLGGTTGGLLGGAIGVMAFVGYIITAVIGLFVGAVILLIISSICKGNTDFNANVRVTAAVMVVMPVNAFLGFITGVNLYVGIIINLAVSIFSLWLIYNGLTEALKSKKETTKIVAYILIAIFVIFMLIGLGAKKAANKYLEEFDNSDMQELLEEFEME